MITFEEWICRSNLSEEHWREMYHDFSHHVSSNQYAVHALNYYNDCVQFSLSLDHFNWANTLFSSFGYTLTTVVEYRFPFEYAVCPFIVTYQYKNETNQFDFSFNYSQDNSCLIECYKKNVGAAVGPMFPQSHVLEFGLSAQLLQYEKNRPDFRLKQLLQPFNYSFSFES